MAVEYIGNLGFVKQPGEKYSVARTGLATYNVSYVGTPSGSLVFSQGNTAVEYPNTVLLDWSISTIDGCRIQIDFHYEGLDTGTPLDLRREQILDVGTSTAPIDTHPQFGSIVSTSGAPIDQIIDGKAVHVFPNGAVFERVSKRFLYFTTYLPDAEGEADFNNLNQKAGIRNYKQPQATFTESLIESSWPDLTDLGYINTPPTNPPVPPIGKNWLFDKARARNIANTYYEIQRTWLLSGHRGWDPDFYTA